MKLTYKYSGPVEIELLNSTVYEWDIYKDGVLQREKRIVPVPNLSPDDWEAHQKALKDSAEAKLVSLGFTIEEASFICLPQG
jgi:hypothetical protein